MFVFHSVSVHGTRENEISVETAYAIAEVSKAIIDTAKVEVQYLKAIESNSPSKFLESKE